jgi:hypothetical protein
MDTAIQFIEVKACLAKDGARPCLLGLFGGARSNLLLRLGLLYRASVVSTIRTK